MDFNDTPEEAAFRAEVRTWLEANASQAGANQGNIASRDVPVEKAWQAKKADAGWACLTWPVEFGGRGASAIQNVIWNQEESKYRPNISVFSIGQGMLAPTLMEHGTDAQKERHLPSLRRGDEIWCQLFSEPAAGSDIAGLRTTAVRDGDDWIINGQKIWTSGAHYCDRGCLVARTDPEAVKHAGITYFIVDMDSPGIDIRPIKQIDGGANFNEVFFSDVRVPARNLVGKRGEGWLVSRSTLKHERNMIGGFEGVVANYRGIIELAKQVKRNGKPAIQDPHIQQQLIELEGYVESHRYSGYRQLTAAARGVDAGIASLMNKLGSTSVGHRAAKLAMDLIGESGLLSPGATRLTNTAPDGVLAWTTQYLWSLGIAIAGGTANIQRNVIAERGLGMPRDRAADGGR